MPNPHHLDAMRAWLEGNSLDGIIIPSTDEFLSEFAPPQSQRLHWATGFRGSVGTCAILRHAAVIFVDGRYRIMAKQELDGAAFSIASPDDASKQAWFASHLRPGDRIILDPNLHSYRDFAGLCAILRRLDATVGSPDIFPVDQIWEEGRPKPAVSDILAYEPQYAGLTSQEKWEALREHLNLVEADALLIADPEDVSWLLNVRSGDLPHTQTPNGWHTVPVCQSRALLTRSGELYWFVDERRVGMPLRALLPQGTRIVPPAEIDALARRCSSHKRVLLDLSRTPHQLAQLVADAGDAVDDMIVARNRWRKQPVEVDRARKGHILDAQAVIRVMAWLKATGDHSGVSEIDIAARLKACREELPEFRGLSMPAMVAAGSNSAIAHYFPSAQSSIALGSHPICWIDSGGQYFGCTTDNTVTLAVGTPEPRHVHAHTLVLKGFIALATARFPAGTRSGQLDALARQHLWRHGLDYGHGTGHGVGNYLNVHEGPLISQAQDVRTGVSLEPGMIVTNEPGYYAAGDFGVRIESHLLVKAAAAAGFLEFKTISRLPIDPDLVDPELLDRDEALWLATYHKELTELYRDKLDTNSHAWLSDVGFAFARMATKWERQGCA